MNAAYKETLGTSPLQDRFSQIMSRFQGPIEAHDRHNLETMFFAGAATMDNLIKAMSANLEAADADGFYELYQILAREIAHRHSELLIECFMLAQATLNRGDTQNDNDDND